MDALDGAALLAHSRELVGPDGQTVRVLLLDRVRAVAAEAGRSTRAVEIAALRHGIVPERYRPNIGSIGMEGQRRLLESRVAIVGAGGLGGTVLLTLARMGVGEIAVADPDRFEESNLNRQALCDEARIGRPKVEAAVELACAVNSSVDVCPFPGRLDESNAASFLTGAAVVADGLGGTRDRLMLQRAARDLNIPLVHGAIAGLVGQVTTVLPGDDTLDLLYGDEGLADKGAEARLGCPSTTPVLIAAVQAQEVVNVILGRPALRRRLLVADLASGTFETMSFD